MKQSAELTGFYRAYLAWVERGAPSGEPFTRGAGLCFNLKLHEPLRYDIRLLKNVLSEMQTQFVWAGLDSGWPFCRWETYDALSGSGTHHTLPARLQWVREHAMLEDVGDA